MITGNLAHAFPYIPSQENSLARVALVVDDSMLIRHTVCRFLEDRGYAAESACNGVEALEMLKTLLPDVIITDVQMPKMDGLQLIDRLKSSSKTAGIPIIVLKGKTTKSEAETDLRADVAIFKDIDINASLEDALKKTVEK
jgi:two-component system chemotaxis response regulator CheY